ncbi:glycosyltransferase [Bradyrhizobium sp. 157]|uniref:CgeB family protein n=1 Tax=Bradyrhizobium sp. 157 TaxID=2782631 RepID=UPI001FFA617C|nr:glycosyltransferase [Bradyrhizobium sp. 157]MCK1636092.1 glycosyltransferase [Bradyrhizobium sp. 157]
MKLDIVMFGLSITSSWGNGHATTYRALIKALAARGHRITFLERNVPWYGDHRDLSSSPHCRIKLYDSLRDVSQHYSSMVAAADVVVLGSFVPDGAALGDWITSIARGVTAFYDIDTPVTLSQLATNSSEYISPSLIPRFDLYLSFTGGPILQLIKGMYGSPRARALYCAVDVDVHKRVRVPTQWALGYIGTYSEDRQPLLEELLLEPARRLPKHDFVVAGAQYPSRLTWPKNVRHIEHLPPGSHSKFYCSLRYTLNLTRQHMAAAGYSPSVRLFEAAACGVPVISDRWPGIEEFFVPEREILLASSANDVVNILSRSGELQHRKLAAAARERVLKSHTAEIRAAEFEGYIKEVISQPANAPSVEAV